MRDIHIKFFRSFAVFLGLFLIITAVADYIGLIPYSEIKAEPILIDKIRKSMDEMFFGLLLLLPYRVLKNKRIIAIIVFIALACLSLVFIFSLIFSMSGYFSGKKSIEIIPVSLIFILGVVGNGVSFIKIVKKNDYNKTVE